MQKQKSNILKKMTQNKKKRIFHMIDTPGQGGAESVMVNIIKSLNSDKYKMFVALPEKGWLYTKLKDKPLIKILIINAKDKTKFHFIYLLKKFIIENNIDVIHAHLFGASFYCSILGLICRKPVICSFHGYIDYNVTCSFLKLKSFVIGFGAKKIVFVSNHLKNYFTDKLPLGQKKYITIYNGIELDSIRTLTKREQKRELIGFKKQDILIGSVGNIKEAKGYDVLLKTACLVKQKYPNCYFLIAGGVVDEKCFNALLLERKQLGLEKNVHLFGFIEDVEKFLYMMDIFLLSSLTEGFSLSTIEAMKAGVPVVATKSGGPQEIIEHKKNGILADAGDEKALADKIIQLIQDDELKKKFTLSGKKTITDRFGLSAMTKQYEALYKL